MHLLVTSAGITKRFLSQEYGAKDIILINVNPPVSTGVSIPTNMKFDYRSPFALAMIGATYATTKIKDTFHFYLITDNLLDTIMLMKMSSDIQTYIYKNINMVKFNEALEIADVLCFTLKFSDNWWNAPNERSNLTKNERDKRQLERLKYLNIYLRNKGKTEEFGRKVLDLCEYHTRHDIPIDIKEYMSPHLRSTELAAYVIFLALSG